MEYHLYIILFPFSFFSVLSHFVPEIVLFAIYLIVYGLFPPKIFKIINGLIFLFCF